MAVQMERTISRFRGLSTDEKPGRTADIIGEAIEFPRIGSIFTEVDTGARFVWSGSWPWVRQEQTIEATLASLIDVNTQMLGVLEAIKRGQEQYVWGDEIETE